MQCCRGCGRTPLSCGLCTGLNKLTIFEGIKFRGYKGETANFVTLLASSPGHSQCSTVCVHNMFRTDDQPLPGCVTGKVGYRCGTYIDRYVF